MPKPALPHRASRVLTRGATGAEVWTYDLSAITELEVDASSPFAERSLPSKAQREQSIRVVLRVPKGSGAESRLCQAWDARVVGPAGEGDLDLAIELDRANAAALLGVLVLQLGAPCALVEPAELAGAASEVAERLLRALDLSPRTSDVSGLVGTDTTGLAHHDLSRSTP